LIVELLEICYKDNYFAVMNGNLASVSFPQKQSIVNCYSNPVDSELPSTKAV